MGRSLARLALRMQPDRHYHSFQPSQRSCLPKTGGCPMPRHVAGAGPLMAGQRQTGVKGEDPDCRWRVIRLLGSGAMNNGLRGPAVASLLGLASPTFFDGHLAERR